MPAWRAPGSTVVPPGVAPENITTTAVSGARCPDLRLCRRMAYVCRACSIARRCKSSPILLEEKGSEAQGRHGDVGSEGSVEQRYEPTNSNWRRGGTVGRGRVRARSP